MRRGYGRTGAGIGPHRKRPQAKDIFLAARELQLDCKAIAPPVGVPNADFLTDLEGFLFRRFRLGDALRKLVPAALRARTL